VLCHADKVRVLQVKGGGFRLDEQNKVALLCFLVLSLYSLSLCCITLYPFFKFLLLLCFVQKSLVLPIYFILFL